MIKEEVLERVKKSFLGHSVAIQKAITTEDKELYVVSVGGQCYSLDGFTRLNENFDGYNILIHIESSSLLLTISKG